VIVVVVVVVVENKINIVLDCDDEETVRCTLTTSSLEDR
jgi:hypothetical protein